MNYQFQVGGVWKDGQRQFLYSEFACADLNEAHLNENKGIPCAVPLANKAAAQSPTAGVSEQQPNEGSLTDPANTIVDGIGESQSGVLDDITAIARNDFLPSPSNTQSPSASATPSKNDHYKTVVHNSKEWFDVNVPADFNQNHKMETGVLLCFAG